MSVSLSAVRVAYLMGLKVQFTNAETVGVGSDLPPAEANRVLSLFCSTVGCDPLRAVPGIFKQWVVVPRAAFEAASATPAQMHDMAVILRSVAYPLSVAAKAHATLEAAQAALDAA
jgi:hypothetical protein